MTVHPAQCLAILNLPPCSCLDLQHPDLVQPVAVGRLAALQAGRLDLDLLVQQAQLLVAAHQLQGGCRGGGAAGNGRGSEAGRRAEGFIVCKAVSNREESRGQQGARGAQQRRHWLRRGAAPAATLRSTACSAPVHLPSCHLTSRRPATALQGRATHPASSPACPARHARSQPGRTPS